MDSEPSPPQNISWVIGAGPCSVVVGTPIPDDSWSRPKEGVLDGLSTLLEDEGRRCDSWVERPITPTLLGYDILEGRAKFTVWMEQVWQDRELKLIQMCLEGCIF